MTEEQFLRAAQDFLDERLGEGAREVNPDTELVESGIMDSLLLLEFFFFLENLTGTEIKPEAATVEGLSTLRNAYRLVVAA